MSRCGFRPRSHAEAEVGCPLDHCMCGTHDVDHDCGPPYSGGDDYGCPTHGSEHLESFPGMVGETILVCQVEGCDWMWEDADGALRRCE